MAHVLSLAQNEPTTNSPGLIVRTSSPTSSTIPAYSWPIGGGPPELLDPAVGPEVRAAHAGGRDADDRVRRLDDPRRFALLDPNVTRGMHDRSAHVRPPR